MQCNTVMVTRPEGQQQALMAALESAGFRAVHAPLIEIQPKEAPDAAQRRLLLDLCDFQHVIFVSSNAIRCGMSWIEDYWPQLPTGLNWYTVGDSSARLLGEFGVPVLVPTHSMNSEGLLALPQLAEVDQERVLVVKGEGGRSLLGDTLAQRGARVDELTVYRRAKPAYGEGEFAERLLSSACDLLLLSSGEGLHNMMLLLNGAALTRARRLTLVVPGARVAQLAAESGFENVLAADNATDAAMLAAAQLAREQAQTGP
jgi:uroporphyrinogen-III synthase